MAIGDGLIITYCANSSSLLAHAQALGRRGPKEDSS